MKRLKADQVIEEGNKTLDELLQIYDNGIAYDKYYELLEHYIKLYKRTQSILKMSDEVGKMIFDKKEDLSENLEYTIKTAKEKLVFNVEEHKKSKKAIGHYKEQISEYKNVIGDYAIENNKLKKQNYKKRYGEFNHTFYDEVPSLVVSTNEVICLNPEVYKNMTVEEIIEQKAEVIDRLIIMNLKLKDFDSIVASIKYSVSLNSFLKSLYKFIKVCFDDDVLVLHHKGNSFFVLTDIQQSKKLNDCSLKLNSKRVLFNNQIVFEITSTTHSKSDKVKVSLEKLKKDKK